MFWDQRGPRKEYLCRLLVGQYKSATLAMSIIVGIVISYIRNNEIILQASWIHRCLDIKLLQLVFCHCRLNSVCC